DVELDRSLALAHADLGGLFRDRLVRKHADSGFALALQVARNGGASRFDLLAGHGGTREGLQGEFAESEGVGALGIPGTGAFLRFAVFGAGGSESHGGSSLSFQRSAISWTAWSGRLLGSLRFQ